MALRFELAVVSLPRIDRMIPLRLDSALFGMGSFSDSEPRFGIEKGVWRTAVGYSGGRYENPSYEDLGDHVETVMVEYAPHSLSYGQLLDIFLNRYGCREGSSSKCISHVFVKNESEKRLAEAAIERYGLRFCGDSLVKTAMYKNFYRAEPWRQKHFLRMNPQLMDELRHIYPDEDRLLQSTLATRLNGILGQRSSREFYPPLLPDDFELYDLSERAEIILKNAIDLPVTAPLLHLQPALA